MSWRVVLTVSTRPNLRQLDPPVASRILDALTQFADTGQADITRLRDSTDEWRLRVGDWRVWFRYDILTQTNSGSTPYPPTWASVPLGKGMLLP